METRRPPKRNECRRGRVRCSFHRPADQPSHAGQDAPRCFRAGFRDQRDVRGDDPARWFASPGHDAARDRRDAAGRRRGSVSRRDLRHYQERRAIGAGAFRPGRGGRAWRKSRGRETGEETDRRARRQSRQRQSSRRRWRLSRDRRQSRRLRPPRAAAAKPVAPKSAASKPRAASVAAAKTTDGAPQRAPDADDGGGIFEGAKQAVGSLTGAVRKLVGAE